MMPREKPLWIKALAAASFLSMIFGLAHVSDAIVRGELGNTLLEAYDATFNSLYGVAYLFGIAMGWNQKRAGYITLLVVSSLSSWGFFGHTTGVTPPDLVQIGRISGVFFVFTVLVGAVASVTAMILSVYGLSKPRK